MKSTEVLAMRKKILKALDNGELRNFTQPAIEAVFNAAHALHVLQARMTEMEDKK